MKFEDRSHEETERQQRCARSKAWNVAQNIYELKEKDKAAFYFSAEEWVLPAKSTTEREEREFEVDSGASMHMVSKKDLNSSALETMRTSRSPATVMTANGQLDLFVRVMLLEETPPVLSLGKLCEDHASDMARELTAIFRTMYHLWFLVLSASSSSTTPTSSSSSSQDSVSVFDVNR